MSVSSVLLHVTATPHPDALLGVALGVGVFVVFLAVLRWVGDHDAR